MGRVQLSELVAHSCTAHQQGPGWEPDLILHSMASNEIPHLFSSTVGASRPSSEKVLSPHVQNTSEAGLALSMAPGRERRKGPSRKGPSNPRASAAEEHSARSPGKEDVAG